MTKEQLIKILRKRVDSAGTAYKVAASLEVTDSHLSDVLSGRREPGPSLLRGLGLYRVVTYKAVKA